MGDALRIYTTSVCLLCALIGTPQLRSWMRNATPQEHLHWMSTVALNVAIGIGTLDAYLSGAPGGWRLYLVAVAVTWLLAAVLYRPVRWLIDRHGSKESQ
jgi:hypothetical protein